MVAIANDCPEAAQLILEVESTQDYINIENNIFGTTLRLATYKFSISASFREKWKKVIALILTKHPDLKKKTQDSTPLMVAIEWDSLDVALYDTGGKKKQVPNDYINITNRKGETALMLAAGGMRKPDWTLNIRLTAAIIDNQAIVTIQDHEGETAFMKAINSDTSQLTFSTLILKRTNPKEYVDIQNIHGYTALTLLLDMTNRHIEKFERVPFLNLLKLIIQSSLNFNLGIRNALRIIRARS